MHRISLGLLVLVALALSACGPRPMDSAFVNRGGPESLIDVSSEVVNLATATSDDREQLAEWILKDQPTRAELNCAPGSKACVDAEKILELSGVPIVDGAATEDSVTLVYERILARDCNHRYIDNPHNFYNVNHRAFGCSLSANMVQQVTDKQEFVEPALSDNPSAVRAVNDIRRAYAPRPIIGPYGVGDSLASKSRAGQ